MSNTKFLTQLLPNTKLEEQRYLKYIFTNPSEVYLISENYFFDSTSKIVISNTKKLLEEGYKFNYVDLLRFCKTEYPEFEEKNIEDIRNTTLDNIDKIKEALKENYLKYNTVLKLEDTIIKATSKGSISFDNLLNSVSDLYFSINDINDINLKNTKDLSENYKQTLQKRKEGIKQRTLGYRIFDKLITKPGAPEQMTALVGMTGGSKTTLAKNIEMKLVTKGIPVVSINLENAEEDCMDLNTCIRLNLPLTELTRKDLNPRTEARILRELEAFDQFSNYLMYTDPELSLNQLDGLLYKSKNIFRTKNVITEDDYMFIIIDLAEMLKEYSESKTAYEIKDVLTKLLQICRRHKCHFLLLIQSSENKIRGGKVFKNPDDLNYFKIGLEDIEGSAAIAKRCRVVITLTRPLQMKKRFFPEDEERWNLEPDIIHLNVVKQNQGKDGQFVKLGLSNTFRIYEYQETED